MKIDINEYKSYTISLGESSPYPRAGSTGVYMGELWSIQKSISSKALVLLLALIASTNEFNQIHKTREELCNAIDIKYDRKRISKLIAELVDNNAICLFGKIVTVSPYLSLPKCHPKLKSAQQEAWDTLVLFA